MAKRGKYIQRQDGVTVKQLAAMIGWSDQRLHYQIKTGAIPGPTHCLRNVRLYYTPQEAAKIVKKWGA